MICIKSVHIYGIVMVSIFIVCFLDGDGWGRFGNSWFLQDNLKFLFFVRDNIAFILIKPICFFMLLAFRVLLAQAR